VIQYVTSACNSRCKMCFYWKNIDDHASKKELSIDEFGKISKRLGGLLQLSLTGGEPFLRDDLPEICGEFIKYSDPLIITIPTNGLLPEKIYNSAKKMLSSGSNSFFRFSLSLDGIGDLHDSIRGVNGNFEKAMETYKKLNELKSEFKNFNIDIGTVMSKFNQNKVKDIFGFVEKNLSVDNHYFALARGKTRLPDAGAVDVDSYADMVRYKRGQLKRGENRPFSGIFREVFELNTEILLETLMKRHMVIPCVAGKNMAIISETGDVYPCEILDRVLGNVRDYGYDVKKIMRSKEGRDALDFIKKEKCFCTFECAINASVIFNPLIYPRVLKNMLCKKTIGGYVK